MIQSDGFLGDIDANVIEAIFITGIEAGKRGTTILAKNETNYFANKKVNELNKKCTAITDLRNNSSKQ